MKALRYPRKIAIGFQEGTCPLSCKKCFAFNGEKPRKKLGKMTIDNAKKIITGYKVTQAGISVESCDKMKALEMLGKYLGMFKDDSTTITNNIINPYANLSEEELRKLAGDS